MCRLVVNMMSVCCFLALGLFSCALCRDGEKGSKLERLQPDFSSDEQHTLSLNKSEVSKRSAGLNEQTCTGFPGVESTLPNNTHTVSHYFTFSNRNYSIKL